MYTSRIIRYFFSVVFCALCFTAQAQSLRAQLSFTSSSPFIADWLLGPGAATLTIINAEKTDKSFKVSTELSYNGALVAKTDVSKMQPTSVAAGSTLRVQAEDIYPANAIDYYGSFDVNDVARTGKVFAGTYVFCTKLVDPQSGADLTVAQCKTFNVTDYELRIIAPANNSTLSLAEAVRLNFKWLMNPKPKGMVSYEFKLFEVGEDRSAAEAADNNSIYTAEVKNKESFVYPIDAPKLEAGKQYAFTISDKNDNGQSLTEKGRSDIVVFRVTGGGCHGTLNIVSDSCLGLTAAGTILHRICATYTSDITNGCNIQFNNPTNNPSNNAGMAASAQANIFCSMTAGVTVSNFSPALGSLPSTLAPGVPASFCFDLVVPAATSTVSFAAFGLCDDGTPFKNAADANKSIALKHCGDAPCTCDSGWGINVSQNATKSNNVPCGQSISGFKICDGNINISAALNCKGNCTAANIHMDISDPQMNPFYSGPVTSFTPTSPGSYTVVLSGTCGNNKCECRFIINVDSCAAAPCKCGHKNSETTTVISGEKSKILKRCSGAFSNRAPATVTFNFPTYSCNTPNCLPTYYFTVSGAGPTVTSSSASSGFTYTFNTAGVYTVKIVYKCGNMLCDSCQVIDTVIGEKPLCDCDSSWGINVSQKLTHRNNVPCNQSITGFKTCDGPISISAILHCKGNCSATKVHMDVLDPSMSQYYSGPVTSFTPTSSGSYMIVLSGMCGDRKCECRFAINVDSCQQACRCDSNTSWNGKQIIFNTMDYSKPVACGQKINLPAGGYNFTLPAFSCNPTSCAATYPWTVNGVPQASLGQSKGFTFTSGTYVLSFSVNCGGNICTMCTDTVVVKDNSCNCGLATGHKITMKATSGLTVTKQCGDVFTVHGTKTETFTFPTYQCSTPKCNATYKWYITPPNSPLSIGGSGNSFNYTLPFCGTFKAVCYSYCGDHLCDSCKATIVVDSCDTPCQCSHKNSDEIIIFSKIGGKTVRPCNGTFVNAAPATITFNFPTYSCAGSNCSPTYIYTVTGAGPSSSSSLASNVFTHTFSTPGIYTIKVVYKCGAFICDSCQVIDSVVRPIPPCDCDSSWGINVSQGAIHRNNVPCNQSIIGFQTCKGPISVSATLNCSRCNSTDTHMEVLDPSMNPFYSGPITSFTPTVAGSYMVILTGMCGNNKCECRFAIKVDTCVNISCCPGTWNERTITTAPMALKCGGEYTVLSGQSYQLNASYFCNNPACTGQVVYSVSNPAGAFVSPTGEFTATVPGNYTVTMSGICGKDVCEKCIIKFHCK